MEWSVIVILILKKIKIDKESYKDIFIYYIEYETPDGIKFFIKISILLKSMYILKIMMGMKLIFKKFKEALNKIE